MVRERFQISLMETFRTVFYTPIYVTVAGGYLESEGLDVRFETCPTQFPHPLSALNNGAADIVQSGIMRSIIAAEWGAEVVPRHFAEINSRDGFFVLGRQPAAEFKWADLEGSTVIPVGFSPMPWASFQYALRYNGVSVDGLTLMPGAGAGRGGGSLSGGRGPTLFTCPSRRPSSCWPRASAIYAVALGKVNGHIAYSSFAATNSYMNSHTGRPAPIHCRLLAGPGMVGRRPHPRRYRK